MAVHTSTAAGAFKTVPRHAVDAEMLLREHGISCARIYRTGPTVPCLTVRAMFLPCATFGRRYARCRNLRDTVPQTVTWFLKHFSPNDPAQFL